MSERGRRIHLTTPFWSSRQSHNTRLNADFPNSNSHRPSIPYRNPWHSISRYGRMTRLEPQLSPESQQVSRTAAVPLPHAHGREEVTLDDRGQGRESTLKYQTHLATERGQSLQLAGRPGYRSLRAPSLHAGYVRVPHIALS